MGAQGRLWYDTDFSKKKKKELKKELKKNPPPPKSKKSVSYQKKDEHDGYDMPRPLGTFSLNAAHMRELHKLLSGSTQRSLVFLCYDLMLLILYNIQPYTPV